MTPTKEQIRNNEVVQATAFFLSKINKSVNEVCSNDSAMRFRAHTGIMASLISSICANQEGERRLEFEELFLQKVNDQLADRSIPELRIKIDG